MPPGKKKCKHCGKPIAERPYGAGTRWEHTTVIAGKTVPTGIFCQTTKAGPRGKRAQ